MTSEERVLAALAGEPVDRLPQFETFWGDFIPRWRKQCKPANGVDILDYYEMDIRICVADETPFFHSQGTLNSDESGRFKRDGWGRLLRERSNAYFYEVISNWSDDRDELLAAPFDDPAEDGRYGGFLQTVEQTRAKQYAPFAKIGGPFLRTTFLRGEETYLMDIAADPVYAKELADRVGDHLLAVGLESLRRAELWSTGIWMFDDIAHNRGLFLSNQSFEQVFLPAYERIVRGCKEAGAKYFVFHSDGDIRALLPYLHEIGVDAINPVEPRSGMDVVALAREWRGKLSFIGGVDNAAVLPLGTLDEIRAHVAPIAKAARDEGGIILGTHSIGSDISVAQYEAYHDTVRAH